MVKDTESLDYSSEPTKGSNKADSIFLFVLGFILVFFVIDWHFIKGEIVEYPIAPCKEYCKGWVPLNKTVYKPSVKKQTVQAWTPGITAPETYKNCSVVSRTNWSCKFSDNSGEIGFRSGDYFNYDLESPKQYFTLGKDNVYTYKVVWYWHYIGPGAWD